MKKFNLFAIGVVAMLMAATGVYADTVRNQITDADALQECLQETGTASCTVTESIPDFAGATVTGKVTLKLNEGVTVETTAPINVNAATASLTIDGGTISREHASEAQIILVTNGTLDVKGTTLKSKVTSTVNQTKKAVVSVYGGKVTMEAGSVIDGYAGLVVYPAGYASSQTTGTTNATTINLNGAITAKQYAVQVNGLVNGGTLKVNVNSGTYTSTRGVAFYAAGAGTWMIKAGVKVSGLEALYVKGGNVTVKGGEFTATVPTDEELEEDPALDNRVASAAKGSTVVVDQDTTYGASGSKATLTIDGGTFTNGKTYVYYNADGDSIIAINDGTFETEGDVAVWSSKLPFINGGSFTSAKTPFYNNKYVSASKGKVVTDGEDGTTTVIGTEKEVTIKTEGENLTVVDLTTPVKAIVGKTVKLSNLAKINASEGYVLSYSVKTKAGKTVTVTGDEFTMPDNDVIVTITAVVKPADTTPAPGDEPGTQEPGTTTPSGSEEQQPGATNPDTLDNVTSVAAMGGISLAIAAAGIATLKKREN